MSRQRHLNRLKGIQAITEYPELLAALRAAQRGAYVEYHRGNLAKDRIASRDLSDRASLVMILAQRGAVAPSQHRPPGTNLIAYTLTVIAPERFPSKIMQEKIRPNDYHILQRVIHARGDRGVSIARRVRDAMSAISGSGADQWVKHAAKQGWIAQPNGREWIVTPQGHAAIL